MCEPHGANKGAVLDKRRNEQATSNKGKDTWQNKLQ